MGKLADYLEHEADALVGRWNDRLLADEGDDPQPRSELIEELPGLLAETVKALRAHDAGVPHESAEARRHRLGFDLVSLVREHGVFRNVVLGRLEEERLEVTGAELRIFIDIMTEALARAVAQHAAQREAERDRRTREQAEVLAQQRLFEQQLIGIVSHDLRNPLNLISMAAHLLGRQDQLSEPATKTVVRIQNATESAARLVRDLLDFTQARLGGGLSVELRPGDLNELVQRVIDEVGVLFPAREVQLVREGDGHGSLDSDRIIQMLQNLVTNALKYSPAGSVVKVVVRSEDHHTTLLVCNEGEPIPAAKLPVVFDSFQRAAGTLDKTSRSVGLGLYIVRHIVLAHRGSVEVESTLERGTIFTVRLPR